MNAPDCMLSLPEMKGLSFKSEGSAKVALPGQTAALIQQPGSLNQVR
jgi:hypothetical protein